MTHTVDAAWHKIVSTYVDPSRPSDSPLYVEGPHRNSPRIAETDSAQAAVAMVVDRLPPGCGPAFAGNAAELAAHENAQSGG
ncbi:DUF6193 family natural product biosynthesis protein [Streptomyces zaomyceticus]|uniref:DUF6193 family natural product biosynthesis protein n=1 Tax=Streptomyces zaomyceticus TaxID=68286 RepID=UPI003716B371